MTLQKDALLCSLNARAGALLTLLATYMGVTTADPGYDPDPLSAHYLQDLYLFQEEELKRARPPDG